MKLNLGSGPFPLEGYVNCDLYPSGVTVLGATEANKDVDVILDLRNGLGQFRDDSIAEVVAFQVLEHLEQPVLLLKEIYRVLEVNGILEITVPDYGIIFREWLEASYEKRWIAMEEWPPLYAWIWGRGYGANRHLSGFDGERLKTLLREVGFRDIEITSPFLGLSIKARAKK